MVASSWWQLDLHVDFSLRGSHGFLSNQDMWVSAQRLLQERQGAAQCTAAGFSIGQVHRDNIWQIKWNLHLGTFYFWAGFSPIGCKCCSPKAAGQSRHHRFQTWLAIATIGGAFTDSGQQHSQHKLAKTWSNKNSCRIQQWKQRHQVDIV